MKSSSPKITSSYQFSGFAGVCRRLRYFFLGFLVGNFRCVKAAICQNRVGVFISRRVLLASFANEKWCDGWFDGHTPSHSKVSNGPLAKSQVREGCGKWRTGNIPSLYIYILYTYSQRCKMILGYSMEIRWGKGRIRQNRITQQNSQTKVGVWRSTSAIQVLLRKTRGCTVMLKCYETFMKQLRQEKNPMFRPLWREVIYL